MTPVENGRSPARNTKHPTGVRVTAGLLALACLILGPYGYLNAISTGEDTAAEWFTIGFGASVGLPLLASAIATVAGDIRTAVWSLALLAWPVFYVTAIHLSLAL